LWVKEEMSPCSSRLNSSLKVDLQGSRVTSDGGLMLVRELNERLDFGELIERHLTTGAARTANYHSPICCGIDL
jgi:hypothetical protein